MCYLTKPSSLLENTTKRFSSMIIISQKTFRIYCSGHCQWSLSGVIVRGHRQGSSSLVNLFSIFCRIAHKTSINVSSIIWTIVRCSVFPTILVLSIWVRSLVRQGFYSLLLRPCILLQVIIFRFHQKYFSVLTLCDG